MRALRFLPILFFLVDGCIDPLSIKLPPIDRLLVVDGLLTDEAGPYQVKLSYSSNLDESLNHPEVETGASVWISDDLNNTELLTEISEGVYQTNLMQGQVGRSYSLKIKTSTGKEYQSSFQKLTPAGTIDNLYYSFEANALNKEEAKDVFNVYIDARGVSNESNLFRWRWTGIYEVKSFPEARKKYVPFSRPPLYIPDPEPCSGYIYDGRSLQRIDECTCCTCWSYEQSVSSLVSDARYINDIAFNKIMVAQVPITKAHFYKRYYIEIEQLSIAEETYNFWKLVEAQQKAVGSLFQPSIVKVIGNIKSITDPAEEVFGIFAVSAVTKKNIFIEREDVPYELHPLDSIQRDCRKSFPYATNVRPPFW